MSDVKPGTLIDAIAQRDAIHVALAPVVAAERLVPSAPIGFVDGSTELVTARAKTIIGIVDPFLKDIVEREQRFWMFLFPQSITSLRHDWTHPAFEAPALSPKDASEQWLREWAEKYPGWSLDQLLDSAGNKLRGAYGFNSRSDIPNGAFDNLKEFWQHYETFTGVKVDDKSREELPYYCSC